MRAECSSRLKGRCDCGKVWTSSYLRKMLRKVRNFELSSVGLSDAGTVGGVEAKFMDTVELAAEGTGDAR